MVCEIMVNFPPDVIKKVRRLSKSAKVHAVLLEDGTLQVGELNGVAVTFPGFVGW